jgi:long-chain acyl-CoA synthetase
VKQKACEDALTHVEYFIEPGSRPMNPISRVCTSAAVEACAVIGVSHPYTGEAVKAYVVVTPGRSVEEDDLIAFCAEHLARYKCPEKVMFVDELAVGAGGKVLRRSLQ